MLCWDKALDAFESVLPSAADQDVMPQSAASDQPHAVKAASKKKQKGGKKAAAKDAKGPRAAAGSTAQFANSEEGATVEFFVAVPDDQQEEDLEESGEGSLHYPLAHVCQCIEGARRRLSLCLCSALTSA